MLLPRRKCYRNSSRSFSSLHISLPTRRWNATTVEYKPKFWRLNFVLRARHAQRWTIIHINIDVHTQSWTVARRTLSKIDNNNLHRTKLRCLSFRVAFIVYCRLIVVIMVSFTNHNLPGNFQRWVELSFYTQHVRRHSYVNHGLKFKPW